MITSWKTARCVCCCFCFSLAFGLLLFARVCVYTMHIYCNLSKKHAYNAPRLFNVECCLYFRLAIANHSIKLNTEWVYFCLLMVLLLFTLTSNKTIHTHMHSTHTCGYCEHGSLTAIQRFICCQNVWLIFWTMFNKKRQQWKKYMFASVFNTH